ncbi:MAG: GreA/GreB family elongation factor [Sphingobium sp.]
MSVAFRRDIDEEHLEPKFEIPIPPGPNLVTPRGLALIRAKVAELEALVPALAEEKALADAKRQLRYWRTRQATARPAPAPDGRTVEIGCTVRLLHLGKERRIAIVGDDEADPASGLLAFSAPLARAIMGAEVGEVLPFGGKDQAIEISEINRTEDDW